MAFFNASNQFFLAHQSAQTAAISSWVRFSNCISPYILPEDLLLLNLNRFWNLIPLVHRLSQNYAGPECQNPPPGDNHLLPRLGISSLSRPLLAGNEIPKAGNFYLLSLFQGLLEDLEYLVHNLNRFLPRKRAFITDN